MPLADMFICNKKHGTAVAKNKEELKKCVLSQFSGSVRRQVSKRNGGSMEVDHDPADVNSGVLEGIDSKKNHLFNNSSPHHGLVVTIASTAILFFCYHFSGKTTPEQAARLPGVKPTPSSHRPPRSQATPYSSHRPPKPKAPTTYQKASRHHHSGRGPVSAPRCRHWPPLSAQRRRCLCLSYRPARCCGYRLDGSGAHP